MHIYFSQRMAAPSHSPVITAHLITESLDWPIWGLGPCLACPCFCGQSEVGWLLTDTGWLFSHDTRSLSSPDDLLACSPLVQLGR